MGKDIGMTKTADRRNSFFRYGNEDIILIEQDSKSKLWKMKFTTPEHYVVSREFDRTVGMYANAPDSVVAIGMMEFSDSLIGEEMSIYSVMDMFIDRCFNDSVFDSRTEKAVWLCMDFLHYEQIEEILNVYSSRIVWPSDDDSDFMRKLLLKYEPKSSGPEYRTNLKRFMTDNGISGVFMESDGRMEELMSHEEFADMPCFVAKTGKSNEFCGFKYLQR